MRMWLPCRHEAVFWIDAHTCCCHECGKTGIWYEEGLVLWCRRRPSQGLRERLTEALEMGHGERQPLAGHPAASDPLAVEPGGAVRQRAGLDPVGSANRRASA